MEETVNAKTVAEWYYEEKGERKGPVTEATIQQMVKDGKLANDGVVWKKGMHDWTKIENTDFKSHVDDNLPPPLSGDKVNNTVIWILAFAPIIGSILEYMFARIVFHNADVASIMVESGKYWFITVALNIGLSYYDAYCLQKAGHDTSKFKGMAWLIPVYLYQRAKALKHNLAYFITWIVCFVITIFNL